MNHESIWGQDLTGSQRQSVYMDETRIDNGTRVLMIIMIVIMIVLRDHYMRST